MSGPGRWSGRNGRVHLDEGGQLSATQLARSIEQVLSAEGITAAALARRMGRSQSWVSNIRRLRKLEPNVLDGVRKGRLSLSHAKALANLDADDQVRIALRAIRDDLSSHTVEAMARRARAGR